MRPPRLKRGRQPASGGQPTSSFRSLTPFTGKDAALVDALAKPVRQSFVTNQALDIIYRLFFEAM